MHPIFYFSRSKISGYNIFYPTKIGVVLLLILTCWTIKTFLDFHHAEANYNVLLRKEENIRQNLSSHAFQELQIAKEKDLVFLENISDCFKQYKIVLPSERLSMTPEQFQDQLQKDVSSIQEKAKDKSIILPPLFFLGLSEYEKVPPPSEEVTNLSKQEFLLFWIADHFCEYSHLNLTQFSFENKIRKLEFIKAEELGCLTIAITANETSFQKLFNAILNSPYYFIVEKITIENSNKNGPPHLLENNDNSIRIVLGRDKLNVVIKIRIIDFIL